MDDAVCADCRMLQQAALVAVIRLNYAPSRLAIGKMRKDSPKRKVLEPLLGHLFQVRIVAGRAYQEHVDAHARATSLGAG